MKARDLMSRPVISVGPDDTGREAVTRLTERGFAAIRRFWPRTNEPARRAPAARGAHLRP
jgi:CBS domain-containing protein